MKMKKSRMWGGGVGQGGCQHEELNYCDNANKVGGGGWHENPVTKYE